METAQQLAQQENEASMPEDTTKVIEAQNPSAEEMKALLENIKINYDFDVDVRPVVFNFKKTTDKETGIETVRKPVELALPFPSVQGIVNILERGGKELELLQEAIESVITTAARDHLNDEGGTELNAANFPVEKLSWSYLASLPKSQRRGGGIPKETWEAFAKDYVTIMPEATGKTVDQVTNAAKILLNKLNQVKTNEPVLQLMIEQLAIYAEASPNAQEYEECITFLVQKAEGYLNVSDEELLANL